MPGVFNTTTNISYVYFTGSARLVSFRLNSLVLDNFAREPTTHFHIYLQFCNESGLNDGHLHGSPVIISYVIYVCCGDIGGGDGWTWFGLLDF